MLKLKKKHFSVSEMLNLLLGHQNVKLSFSHKNVKFKNILYGLQNFLTEKLRKVVQLKCQFQNSQILTIGYLRHFVLRIKEISEVI
jgi:hypothetical protein